MNEASSSSGGDLYFHQFIFCAFGEKREAPAKMIAS